MSKTKTTVRQTDEFILDRPYEKNAVNACKRMARAALAGMYRINLALSRPARGRNCQYNVSICAIFKDEGEILREWLEYHLIVGVDHFYMYNNFSSDNYASILAPYIEAGVVTLVDWPHEHSQMAAYRDAMERFGSETKWMGFIDLDEFIVPCQYDTVYDFLKKFDNKAPAVLIYWKVFGSSGLLEREADKLTVEQFTVAFPKMNDVGKCFYNTAFEFDKDNPRNDVLHHILWCRWKGLKLPPVNMTGHIAFANRHVLRVREVPIQINHYVTKSYRDYYNKTHHKSDVYYAKNPRKMEQFYLVESFCTDRDLKIFKYLTKLKLRMKGEKED